MVPGISGCHGLNVPQPVELEVSRENGFVIIQVRVIMEPTVLEIESSLCNVQSWNVQVKGLIFTIYCILI